MNTDDTEADRPIAWTLHDGVDVAEAGAVLGRALAQLEVKFSGQWTGSSFAGVIHGTEADRTAVVAIVAACQVVKDVRLHHDVRLEMN